MWFLVACRDDGCESDITGWQLIAIVTAIYVVGFILWAIFHER